MPADRDGLHEIKHDGYGLVLARRLARLDMRQTAGGQSG
jgi:hypothetical protein